MVLVEHHLGRTVPSLTPHRVIRGIVRNLEDLVCLVLRQGLSRARIAHGSTSQLAVEPCDQTLARGLVRDRQVYRVSASNGSPGRYIWVITRCAKPVPNGE
jgi:hypothetical protein